jgi:hypothetical protein
MSEPVGYLHFDTQADFDLLSETRELDRVYGNNLLAKQELVLKQRNGSEITKRQSRVATLFERARVFGAITDKGPLSDATDQGCRPPRRALPRDQSPHHKARAHLTE